MAADPELAQTFGARWAELGFARTVPLDATITPPRDGVVSVSARAETARLPRISLSFVAAGAAPEARAPSGGDVHADLEVHGLLGEGGMGRVHGARQRSLSRDVAVKVLKHDATSPGAMAALLREAVITGALEHPGIVPVHALGVDDRGFPVLVMKRVEGVEWRQLIHESEHPAWSSRTGDRLVAHLEILMQVCQAVHFAHSRGIVHRDIKPENVMLGDFGEVYLVDWGIAVGADDAARTEGTNGLVGTPAYMAPEMVAGRPVDPRTDVYLLGATLHEVLTGSFRNAGETLQEVLLSAFCAEPFAYPASVPAELAELANRATARDPLVRPESALELRQSIANHLRHRGAALLLEEAAARHAELRQMLDSAPEGAPPVELDRAYRLATEARFGFIQALRDWPESEAAQAGLSACLESLVDLELRQGHIDTAEALAREVTSPSPRLAQMLERGRRRQQRIRVEQERLEAIAHDLDTRVATKQRARSLAAVAGASLAVSAFALSQPNPARLRPAALLAFAIVVLIAGGGVIFAFRRALFQNAFNRRLVGLALVSGLALVGSRSLGVVLGMPAPLIFVQDLLLLSAVAAAASVMLRWMWILVPLLVLGVAGCVVWPGYSPLTFTVVGVLCPPLIALALWRHHREEDRSRLEGMPESVELSSRREL